MALPADAVGEGILSREGGKHYVVGGNVRGKHDIGREGMYLGNPIPLGFTVLFSESDQLKSSASGRVIISQPGYLSKSAFLKAVISLRIGVGYD